MLPCRSNHSKSLRNGIHRSRKIINMHKTEEFYKIIIMGAGVAGLGAALKLNSLGFRNFLILEAQDLPGGRINTITVDGKPLDIGAQWLHGKENPLYEMAKEYNLLSDEVSEEGLGIFIRNDGTVLDDLLVKTVDFQIGKILEDCTNFNKQEKFPISVGNYMEERFLQYLNLSDDSEEVKEMKLELFDWHLRFQIIDNSCQNMRRLSAKHWGDYSCLDDVAHFNLIHGYKSLIDVMLNNLRRQEELIRLNTEVTKIDYNNEQHGNIKVTCNNNKVIYCDHLIITASLGVLKNFSNINPPFPKHLQDSICDIGFYGIGKIYLFFDKKWWGDLKGFQFIWKCDAILESNETWLRHLTGFDMVFNHPNVLIGWVGSNGVDEMESFEEEEVGSMCIKLLRKFLPGFEVPNPKKVIRTKWLSNPHVKGSYCHITPECDESGSGIYKLSDPVYVEGVPRIILAGEAVHPSHYSTTHGAYESGQKQAAFLYNYINREQNS